MRNLVFYPLALMLMSLATTLAAAQSDHERGNVKQRT